MVLCQVNGDVRSSSRYRFNHDISLNAFRSTWNITAFNIIIGDDNG